MISSMRARLTLWYVGLLAAVLVLFSVGVYGLVARLLSERLDSDLRAIQHVAVTSLTHDALEGQSVEDAAESTVRELANPPQAVTICDVNGRLLAENGFDDDPPPRPPLERLTTVGLVDVYTEPEEPGDDDMRRVVAQRVRVSPGDRDYIILVSEPLEAIDEELQALREALAYAIPAALVLAGLGGWFLAQRSLRPAVEMSKEARRISAEDPDRRLPIANPNDELGVLATNFNELLGRLNAAIAQQRQFMADASHELRTPLSVVGTAVEVTLERENRDEDEYREALTVIGEQNQRLARAVEDMFTLARADSGRYPLRREAFYLDELVTGTARAARVLAERRGVELVGETDGEAPFVGDEHLVRQLVMNLLENAIKHTPEGGEVRVTLERAPASYTITVADKGSGIPDTAQPHVFERFYRADLARSRAEASPGSGAGLGLPISRWIAEVHDGRLELVRSDASGTTFRAVLPRTR
jgi:two-component system, OmpR family, sensor kinase